jgi:hypothetical protein
MSTLYLAWQAPATRSWYVVGRLTTEPGVYRFVYTRGALRADREAGFGSLSSFPELNRVYDSESLFPIFANRLMPQSRREYPEFVEWMSVSEHESDPMALLARSGGMRATDSLEVFPEPEQRVDGSYYIHFFAHGLRHFPSSSTERAKELLPGERLLLMRDFQNEHDPRAIMLRTAEQTPGDIHSLGFCPRYLLDDLLVLLERNPGQATVEVERVNPPPAPVQFRLLCSLTMRWPEGFRPFASPDYQPVSEYADEPAPSTYIA